MIQIVPVESKATFKNYQSDYFKESEYYFRMEMQDGAHVMGAGDVFVKGHVAYLLNIDINESQSAYMIFDSMLRALMNLSSLKGAILFNANELYPLMGYFSKHEFDHIQNYTNFQGAEHFEYSVAIEPFFARPCKG